MGKHTERVFKKHSLKLNTPCHNDTSWYTDSDGFLEHSPTRGGLHYKESTLQKIILGVLAGTLHHTLIVEWIGETTLWSSWLFLKIDHSQMQHPSNSTPRNILKENSHTPQFIQGDICRGVKKKKTFKISNTWTCPKSPSTEQWMKKT